MWNTTVQSEYNPGNHSSYPRGGVAPLQPDLACHAYLEKKRAYAAMDRCAAIAFAQTAMVQWVRSTLQQRYQDSRRWWTLHLGHATSAAAEARQLQATVPEGEMARDQAPRSHSRSKAATTSLGLRMVHSASAMVATPASCRGLSVRPYTAQSTSTAVSG